MTDQSNHPAGSATGIDLTRQMPIKTTDQAREYLADWHQKNFPTDRTFHRYIMGRDRHCALAGDFAWQMATALELAAIARATPQHPDDLSNAEFLSKRLARVAKLAGVTMPTGTHEQIADVAGTILGDIARHLEKAATPQHSVTEQDEPVAWRFQRDSQAAPGVPDGEWQFMAHGNQALDLQGKRLGWKPNDSFHCWEPLHTRAQPLASTAATQPEQASYSKWSADFIVQHRRAPTGKEAWSAALAIPASTAASEQQTWVDAQNETYIRRMQEGAASEQQASVSEAGERTLPEGFTLAPVQMSNAMREYLQDRLHSPICKADVLWKVLLKMGLGMEDE